jgi:ribonuclease HII
MRAATAAAIVSRCVRGIDSRGLHVTNVAALHDALVRVVRPGTLCLTDGFRVPDIGHDQRAVIDGDETSAAIAAALDPGQGLPRPVHEASGRAAPGLGVRAHVGYSTPSTARRSSAWASRRCTGARSSRSPTSSSRSSSP